MIMLHILRFLLNIMSDISSKEKYGCIYANYTGLENKINNHDWNCLYNTLPLNQAIKIFFLNYVQECIPSKEVIVRSDDKPCYDNEIRKFSRKSDRLKTTAVTSKRPEDSRKYKTVRNIVDNMKNLRKKDFIIIWNILSLKSLVKIKGSFGNKLDILLNQILHEHIFLRFVPLMKMMTFKCIQLIKKRLTV